MSGIDTITGAETGAGEALAAAKTGLEVVETVVESRSLLRILVKIVILALIVGAIAEGVRRSQT